MTKIFLRFLTQLKGDPIFIYYSTCPKTMVAIEMTAVTKVFWENLLHRTNVTVLNNAFIYFLFIYLYFLLRMSLFLHTAHLI